MVRGALVSTRDTSLGNLRSLSYIRAAELDFARLFGADGLSILSFDEKAKAGRFPGSGAEDDSESDSDSDGGAGSSPMGTTANVSVVTGSLWRLGQANVAPLCQIYRRTQRQLPTPTQRRLPTQRQLQADRGLRQVRARAWARQKRLA